MHGTILLSTAYMPPAGYFSLLSRADTAFIEKEENYTKQTYRNRCVILTANGVLTLTVPVMQGSFHKTAIKDCRIDYTKRWTQVHLRAISAAYRAAPYFDFYYDEIEKIISKQPVFLLDLNHALLAFLASAMKITVDIHYTAGFAPAQNAPGDYRYCITPKAAPFMPAAPYQQVFSDEQHFVANLSTIDLLFNTGPDACLYLNRHF